MDTDTLLLQAKKRQRRTHSPAFKPQVLRECAEPGASVAAVAQRHGLNANLIHKWKSMPRLARPEGFMPVALPVRQAAASSDKVLFEVEGLKVHWPLSAIERALPWLQGLLK